MPKPHDKADAAKFVEIAQKLNGDIEKGVAETFAFTCRASLQPTSSAVGAMAAQEAVKVILLIGQKLSTKKWSGKGARATSIRPLSKNSMATHPKIPNDHSI